MNFFEIQQIINSLKIVSRKKSVREYHDRDNQALPGVNIRWIRRIFNETFECKVNERGIDDDVEWTGLNFKESNLNKCVEKYLKSSSSLGSILQNSFPVGNEEILIAAKP